MREILVASALVLCSSDVGWAERELREIAWLELDRRGALPDGAQVQTDGSLSVMSSSDEGLAVTLVEVDSPGITEDRYVMKGRVRYQDVSGDGYLEMWSVFEDGRYFSRTLAERGPFGKITGSSDWRELVIPFDATGAKAPPERLILNLVLPGRGEVFLSPLTLVELEEGDGPIGEPDGASAGWWGGMAGAVLGTFAGIFGLLAGAGRAKGLVLFGFRTMMAIGGLGLIIGLVSLSRGLPYHVYYPLLLLGTIALVVPAVVLPNLKKRYEELELRRMRALDA